MIHNRSFPIWFPEQIHAVLKAQAEKESEEWYARKQEAQNATLTRLRAELHQSCWL